MIADGRVHGDAVLPHSAQRFEPLSLLLIEDSPADARLLQEQLREPIRRGELTLQTVRRLSDATTALQRMRYSCALVDLGLPDAHGISLLSALRKIDPDAALIVLTGMDSDVLAQQIMDQGAQDYLVKGRYDSGLLLRRIRFAVRHHHRERRAVAFTTEGHPGMGRDAVSGLPNRGLFEDRAACALAQAESLGAGVTMLSIAIDGLTDGGDDILCRIGDVMSGELRKSDTVAMLAHGEYAILLAPADARFDAVSVARRLGEALSALDTANGTALQPRIGIASYPDDGLTAGALQDHAEQAMVRAQRTGAGVCLYRDQDRSATRDTICTATIWTGSPFASLDLRYQPWFDGRTGAPVGIEVQWSSDDLLVWRGAGPALRREASAAMLSTALARFQYWRRDGIRVPVLTVALDTAWLDQPELPTMLDQALARFGLDPRDLQLQVAAEMLVGAAASPESLMRLHKLRDRGFGLTLGGFPEAADGLGALTVIELDAVRLGPQSTAAVPSCIEGTLNRPTRAVIGAAAALGIDLIATGVSDPGSRGLLLKAGVRYLQGGHLCPPLHAAELAAVWRSTRAA